ncbi:hypothetical protein ACFL2R_02070 [Patescibacteria group bacterium]
MKMDFRWNPRTKWKNFWLVFLTVAVMVFPMRPDADTYTGGRMVELSVPWLVILSGILSGFFHKMKMIIDGNKR